MAVDVTPYGLSFDHGDIRGGKVVGFSYKWLSGIALALVAGIIWGSRWVGVILEHNSSGKMSCNTTVHSVQLEFGLLLCSLHVSFGFSYGKRDDAYIASLPKTFDEMAAKMKALHEQVYGEAGYPPDFGGGSLRQDN
jgi:hypothetical protein